MVFFDSADPHMTRTVLECIIVPTNPRDYFMREPEDKKTKKTNQDWDNLNPKVVEELDR